MTVVLYHKKWKLLCKHFIFNAVSFCLFCSLPCAGGALLAAPVSLVVADGQSTGWAVSAIVGLLAILTIKVFLM